MISNSAPGTPSKRNSNAFFERDELLNKLSTKWNLQLQPPKSGESPSKRLEKIALASSSIEARKDECVFKFGFLWLKNKEALSQVINAFEINARVICKGWIHKPKGDPDVFSVTPNSAPLLVTPDQRVELLECFHRHVHAPFVKEKQAQPSRSYTRSPGAVVPTDHGELSLATQVAQERVTPLLPSGKLVDDSPIPLNFRKSASTRGKRSSDGVEEVYDGFKKPKLPSALMDDDFTRSFNNATGAMSEIRYPSMTTLNDSFNIPVPSDSQGDRPPLNSARYMDTSAETSFSSLFSRRHEGSFSSRVTVPSSAESIAQAGVQIHLKSGGGSPSTHYGGTPEIDDLDEIMSDSPSDPLMEVLVGTVETDIEDKHPAGQSAPTQSAIRKRLDGIFPKPPAWSKTAPLCLRYEIVRVCLHAKVPIINQIPRFTELRKYNDLWKFLKDHPHLMGKEFPEKSAPDAWEACWNTYSTGFYGVVLSAGLTFNTSPTEPLFSLRLKPLKLDLSHRLSRRFGNDRFMELTLPNLSGSKLPKVFVDSGDEGRQDVIKWLCNGLPPFLGREWKAFYVKYSRDKKKYDPIAIVEVNNLANDCLYLFAVDGPDFGTWTSIPIRCEPHNRHTKMNLKAMLNWLIPFQDNSSQSFLKLFSRIGLGLSRTWATVELEPHQIRDKQDLLSSDGEEVMNDGCGQMSLALAIQIRTCLGLQSVPSGFQGRIGGAKGFWIIRVDPGQDDECWIEIYPSQRKWRRGNLNPSDQESDHRTFEVCSWVKPLTPASLNLQFLPLLEACAVDSRVMRDDIAKLLRDGLSREVKEQRIAMDSSAAFRQWVGRSRSSLIDGRLKYGMVPYKAALPVQLEEKLNLLIDAGFDPKKLQYFKSLAWSAYRKRCSYLQERLKVTVGRSAYALIAIDFAGILEPDEVHIGFSTSFKDELSGWEDTTLVGQDILVARAPAHFKSDIQRVKAVWKPELRALKDIAVFSSRGRFPLAKKLSGGDYDGDKAWICWEPSLVENFRSADMPITPDLVKDGYISKNRTTFADLQREVSDDVIPTFLERSLEFSLQENLLGRCTVFKEQYCYTVGKVDNYEAMVLSQLLSDLVDQSKQGLTFTFANFSAIKDNIIKRPNLSFPEYKRDKPSQKVTQRSHIIDYLKFIVAEDTIENTKKDFHNSLQAAVTWDTDLAKYAKYATEQAKSIPEWASLLRKLEIDIDEVKKEWSDKFLGRPDDSEFDGSEFGSILIPLYEMYQAIHPEASNTLGTALLPTCFHQDFSDWSLLKASVTFQKFHKTNFVWWMAGKQLAFLKAKASSEAMNSGGLGIGSFHIVTPRMYVALKPDAKVVKYMQQEEIGPEPPELWDLISQGDFAEEEQL